MQRLFLWGEPEMTKLTSLSLALIVAMTSNAFAHHPLGGAAPETMLHGFLSGVGHPIIGPPKKNQINGSNGNVCACFLVA